MLGVDRAVKGGVSYSFMPTLSPYSYLLDDASKKSATLEHKSFKADFDTIDIKWKALSRRVKTLGNKGGKKRSLAIESATLSKKQKQVMHYIWLLFYFC